MKGEPLLHPATTGAMEIDLQIAHLQHILLGRFLAASPPQNGSETRGEFAKSDGFGYIVVRPASSARTLSSSSSRTVTTTMPQCGAIPLIRRQTPIPPMPGMFISRSTRSTGCR